MVSEHPIGLNQNASSAFEEAVRSRTVGIANLVLEEIPHSSEQDQRQFFESVGTGSALYWRGRELLLTAKHVLDRASGADLRFFPRVLGYIESATPSQFAPAALPDMSAREKISVDKIIRCAWEDLAAIVFSRGAAAAYKIDFHVLDGNVSVPRPGTNVLMIGHPTDSAFDVSRHQLGPNLQTRLRGIYPTILTSSVDDVPKFWQTLRNFEPERHFLVPFSPARDEREPLGFSGTGVWCYRQERTAVWVAKPSLEGVCTHYYRPSQRLKIVNAEQIQRFLSEEMSA